MPTSRREPSLSAAQGSILTTSSPRFFFNDTAPTEIYTLPLLDALPICAQALPSRGPTAPRLLFRYQLSACWNVTSPGLFTMEPLGIDRKSTRLNSSHQIISYAVFCLKKKKQ